MTPAPARILVYGVTGSGKSVLAERIGTALNLPWYSVDDLTWEPGWVPVPVEDQRMRISVICARECWILDSAYGQWRDIPLSRAELIVGLDYPRWLSLCRLIRRTGRRIISGELACNGNRESLRSAFSRDSIIVWHFRSFKRKQRRMREWHADPDLPPVVLVRSPRAAKAWLQQLGATYRPPLR
ncbi:MAG: adenylate kinase [Pseudonocardiaceae bacterium]